MEFCHLVAAVGSDDSIQTGREQLLQGQVQGQVQGMFYRRVLVQGQVGGCLCRQVEAEETWYWHADRALARELGWG